MEELQRKIEEPDFWNDPCESQKVMKELRTLENVLDEAEQLLNMEEEITLLLDMATEEEEESFADEAKELLSDLKALYNKLRIQTLLSGEYDKSNAIISIHSGEGGTESCDWANMLYRMYKRFAEAKGFTVEVLDYLEGDVVGVKGVTFEVRGENAYGFLKSEKGVHRLVRLSPFNAAGKRMTSFASCDVIPEVINEIEISIADEDIRVDTYRASGAGGQHVNKTSSAIRITYLPLGIVVQCQSQRSQMLNKEKAMQMLKAKLQLIKEQEQVDKIDDIRGEQKENGFGSQIRSYVLQPYTLVKDKRTNVESTNVNGVLDGDIDTFINGYLKWINDGEGGVLNHG